MADIKPAEGLTIRAVLVFAFGLTFGIWLFSGAYFARRVAQIQNQSEAVNTRYIHSQDLLSTIRSQILAGSVYGRDALLDPDPDTTVEYRRQLETSLRTVDEVLARYQPLTTSPEDEQRLRNLRRDVDEFRETTLGVLDRHAGRWPPADPRSILRNQITPRRDETLRAAEGMQSANRAAFLQQQAELGTVYRVAQRTIWRQLGFALAASFGIGLLAMRLVSRLERRLRDQRAKETQNARDLQRLSAQLITAQEEERRTIARELHDEVGQVLTAVKVELAIAHKNIEAIGGSAELLAGARTVTDGALQTVRQLSRLLHPAVLDDMGLPAALQSYLREIQRRHGIHLDLTLERMEQRLSAEIETAAYRVVQEALTNVVKHAHATRVTVSVIGHLNELEVAVEDNGRGFDTTSMQSATRDGLGLLGIRERVTLLGGTFELKSAPQAGTRLCVRLPLRGRETGGSEIKSLSRPEIVHA